MDGLMNTWHNDYLSYQKSIELLKLFYDSGYNISIEKLNIELGRYQYIENSNNTLELVIQDSPEKLNMSVIKCGDHYNMYCRTYNKGYLIIIQLHPNILLDCINMITGLQ